MYPSVPQKDYQDVPYSKVWSALTYVQLLSSAGNKICGKIQCRAVGTFASLLAPLLLPPVPHNTGKALRTLFFFFPSKILCGVSLSIFSGIHVVIQKALSCWSTRWHHC